MLAASTDSPSVSPLQTASPDTPWTLDDFTKIHSAHTDTITWSRVTETDINFPHWPRPTSVASFPCEEPSCSEDCSGNDCLVPLPGQPRPAQPEAWPRPTGFPGHPCEGGFCPRASTRAEKLPSGTIKAHDAEVTSIRDLCKLFLPPSILSQSNDPRRTLAFLPNLRSHSQWR